MEGNTGFFFKFRLFSFSQKCLEHLPWSWEITKCLWLRAHVRYIPKIAPGKWLHIKRSFLKMYMCVSFTPWQFYQSRLAFKSCQRLKAEGEFWDLSNKEIPSRNVNQCALLTDHCGSFFLELPRNVILLWSTALLSFVILVQSSLAAGLI